MIPWSLILLDKGAKYDIKMLTSNKVAVLDTKTYCFTTRYTKHLF